MAPVEIPPGKNFATPPIGNEKSQNEKAYGDEQELCWSRGAGLLIPAVAVVVAPENFPRLQNSSVWSPM